MQSRNHQYTVSRNGITLSWQQIHNKYNHQIPTNPNNPNDTNTPSLDSNTLLQLLPRGAYTTCRTVRCGSHIYQFDHHVKRLVESVKSILNEVVGAAASGQCSCVGSADDNVWKNDNVDQDGVTSMIQDGIKQVEMTKLVVLLEHDKILKCIQNTLKEFCSCYGLQQMSDGSIMIDNVCNCEGEDDGIRNMETIEFKITLLATWETNSPSESNEAVAATATEVPIVSPSSYQSVLYCHVGLLRPKTSSTPASSPFVNKSPYIRVLIHGHGRENALAKDSKWVLEREKLTKPSTISYKRSGDDNGNGNTTFKTALVQQEFEEIILINDKGELLEGTQTNFYVVSSDQSTVITANEGILHGSVRDSVLRACQHHSIPVELRPPTLQDLRCASGVFISSTSRWVMPVHEVYLGDLLSLQNGDDEEGSGVERKENKDNVRSFVYSHCSTTDDIRQWVSEDVESRSTAIFIDGLQ